jgi:cytidylate kinase
LDGSDVSQAIREIAVTSATHYAADNPGVRQILVELQRTIADSQNVVSEGRDQGTVVFPDAPCKIFLTATPQERARRRLEEITARGEQATFEEILSLQEIRDHRDSTRPCGPLKQAEDAIEVLTDGLSADEVVDRLENLVRSHLPPVP